MNESEASHPEYQTSAALSNQTPVQYPQSAAQSTTWRTRFTISPLPPRDETRFNLVTNGIRPIRSSPRETPIPARPSTSSGRPHRSVLNSRHISSFNDHVTDQRQSSRPNYCPQLAPDPLHDPEKAYNMRNRSPNDPHTTHAFADYIAEEEEDLEEHAVWILVSEPNLSVLIFPYRCYGCLPLHNPDDIAPPSPFAYPVPLQTLRTMEATSA
ncbi:MAG: hypothetical protein Q9197_004107 [Variospora fuerteventurae]